MAQKKHGFLIAGAVVGLALSDYLTKTSQRVAKNSDVVAYGGWRDVILRDEFYAWMFTHYTDIATFAVIIGCGLTCMWVFGNLIELRKKKPVTTMDDIRERLS